MNLFSTLPFGKGPTNLSRSVVCLGGNHGERSGGAEKSHMGRANRISQNLDPAYTCTAAAPGSPSVQSKFKAPSQVAKSMRPARESRTPCPAKRALCYSWW
jgi:hypothetical protein